MIYEALKEFSIGIGSHAHNPNSKPLTIPKGTELTWDCDAPNGNVWFYVTINGVLHRGKIESGCVQNVIDQGLIKLKNF